MINKTYFYIFIIISHNFISLAKNCDAVNIKPSEYNFEIFKGEEHASTFDFNEDKSKIIQVFDYYYLLYHHFKNNIDSDIKKNLEDSIYLEKQKFKPDIIIYLLKQMFGNDHELKSYLEKESTQLSKIFSNEVVEKMKEYSKTKEEETSNTSIMIKSAGTTALAAGSSILLKKFLLTSLSNPSTILLALGIYTLADIGGKLYNYLFFDSNIFRSNNSAYKLTKLLEYLNVLIYEGRWVDNNCVLTAISGDDDCLGSQVQFYYHENIKYKNNHGEDDTENVIDEMINLTCSKRRSVCDYETCFTNLKIFSECPSKRRKKEVEKCPKFNENCTLKFR